MYNTTLYNGILYNHEFLSSSSSSSSSSSLSITGKHYSRGDIATLPVNDADAEHAFTIVEYITVQTEDESYIEQCATNEYAFFVFKDDVLSGNTANVICKLKSSLAPSTVPVHLQVYNRNSTTWETKDTNNTTSADTKFTLSCSINPLSDYADGSGWVACRVYQYVSP